MDWLTDPNAWVALATLTSLEIVLGVDNVVFISVLAERLPEEQRSRARSLGLLMALLGRIALLFSISWVMGLTEELFTAMGHDISVRDLILLGGGLFLLFKATREIHASLEGEAQKERSAAKVSFGSVLFQILVLDLVFSLDSVITAVGMVEEIGVMITAVVLAILFMILTAAAVSQFVHRHPTVKMLALAFLLLVGVALVAESFEVHLPRGYIYFAMGFSVFVEMLNLRRRATKPVELHERKP